MKKILMTGFEPFGNDTINPSLEAVKVLQGRRLRGGHIETCSVPVVRYKAIDVVIEAISRLQPDIVITVGQAGGRSAITPERIAINVDDFRIPDNDGVSVIDEPVIVGGPAAYFSTLPIKAMVKNMQEKGIPAQLSNTAGTFVCNHLFYGIQHYLASGHIRHGFIHIPLIPEQAPDGSQPTMTLDLIIEGLVIAAQAAVDNDTDIHYQLGTVS